jgi:serine/threonine protein kinase
MAGPSKDRSGPPDEPTIFNPAPPSAGAAEAGSHRPIRAGDVLNHIFEVKRFIARGGMGEVFEGINVNTTERVAIKVMLPGLAADEKLLAMFRKEAWTLTRLNHPALVQYRVLAQEPQLGVLYIVTDFVDGTNLADMIGELRPTPIELIQLTRRLAEGLGAAHALGAIHRDMSPENVMLEGGRLTGARIIDFGVAKDLTTSSATIIGDGFAGKLNYIAPEQLGDYDRSIGPWTDIYSLGLVILAVAAGKDVEMGGTLVNAVDKRRTGPDLSAAPEALRPMLVRMLKPDPAERLRSTDELIKLLPGVMAAHLARLAAEPPAEAASPEKAPSPEPGPAQKAWSVEADTDNGPPASGAFAAEDTKLELDAAPAESAASTASGNEEATASSQIAGEEPATPMPVGREATPDETAASVDPADAVAPPEPKLDLPQADPAADAPEAAEPAAPAPKRKAAPRKPKTAKAAKSGAAAVEPARAEGAPAEQAAAPPVAANPPDEPVEPPPAEVAPAEEAKQPTPAIALAEAAPATTGSNTEGVSPAAAGNEIASRRNNWLLPMIVAAGVIIVLAVGLWFGGLFGSRDARNRSATPVRASAEPRPADPAAVTAALKGTLASVSCSWLDIAQVSRTGAGAIVSLQGAAGRPNEIAAQVNQILAAKNLPAAQVNVRDVAPLDTAECPTIDVLRQIRDAAGSRISVPQRRIEMSKLTSGAYAGSLGAKAIVDFDLSDLDAQVALFGIEPSGNIVQLTSDRAELVNASDDLGDGRYRLTIDVDHAGWSGMLLLSGRKPFDGSLLAGPPGSRTGDWSNRFRSAAQKDGWEAEMVWFETVDEQPE